MRAIFLDFDGPMHPVSAIEGLTPPVVNLDEEIARRGLMRHVQVLHGLLQDHDDVGIIVHSAWRKFLSNSELRAMLGVLGHRLMGVTPPSMKRYEGILDTAERAGVQEMIVIDDAADEFPPHLSELLLTDPEQGLAEEALRQRLSRWLAETAQSLQECEVDAPSTRP